MPSIIGPNFINFCRPLRLTDRTMPFGITLRKVGSPTKSVGSSLKSIGSSLKLSGSTKSVKIEAPSQDKPAEQATAAGLAQVDVSDVPLGDIEARVPVFPIGDSLLEPFWPQGLGSNRGFHSALDAVWAVHLTHESGLEAALLERNFFYDLMLQGPWQPHLLKPSKGWSADPVTRYVDGAIVRTKGNYTNPHAKRLFRGAGATPTRVEKLDLKAERGAGGAARWH